MSTIQHFLCPLVQERRAHADDARFTGVLIVANLGVLLYESVGMTGSMPLLLNAIWVSITFPLNIFTALYVDKIGRRTLLLVGLAGCTISNIFEIALQATYVGTDNQHGLNAAIFLFVVGPL